MKKISFLILLCCALFIGQREAFALDSTCVITQQFLNEGLPYSENFNNFQISPISQNCYTTSFGAGAPAVYFQPYGIGGSTGIRFSAIGWVALPILGDEIDLASLKFTFNYSLTDDPPASAIFEIGVSSNINNIAGSFTAVKSISYTETGWIEDFTTFDVAGLTGRYIVVKSLNPGYEFYMDNFQLEINSGCAPPANLTFSDVTGSSAQVSWLPGSPQTTGYNVYYSSDTINGWEIETTNTNSCLLDGLSGATKYFIKVAAQCGDSESAHALFSFYTKCDNYTGETIGNESDTIDGQNLPISSYLAWSFSQQIFLADEIDSDLQQISAIAFQYAGTTSRTREVRIYLSHTNSTTFSSNPSWINVSNDNLYFSNTYTFENEVEGGWVVLELDSTFVYDNTQNLLVSIGIVNAGPLYTNAMTFNTSQTDATRSAYLNTDSPLSMPPLSRLPSGTSDYRSNIRFLSCGEFECAAPATIMVEEVDAHSASLRWTNSSGFSEYLYQYKKATEQEWSALESSTSNSITIGELDPLTNYEFRVRTFCSSDYDTSAFALKSFTTSCAEITLPYVEDFDTYNNNTTPTCWEIPIFGSSAAAAVTRTNVNSGFYSSPNSAFRIEGTGTGYKFAILPALAEDIPVNLLTMNFNALFSNVSSSNYLIIGFVTSPESLETFEAIDTVYAQAGNSWSNYTILFEDYEGEGRYISFRWTNSGTTLLYIDDPRIDYSSPCGENTNFNIAELHPNSAIIEWEAEAATTQWFVEYGNAHFSPGSGSWLTTYNNDIQIEDLQANTLYDVYIYSYCNGDTGIISNVVRFRTPQDTAFLPYFCDFENSVEEGNWTLIHDFYANQWSIGNAANNSENGSSALYISNDQGATNSYESPYGSEHIVWAYRDIYFDEIAPNYNISFDWKSAGGSYSWFSAFIGTPQEVTSGFYMTNPQVDTIIFKGHSSNNWESISHSLPSHYNGTTQRLYFLWYNTGSITNPPAAIDNISINAQYCEVPSGLTIHEISHDSIRLSWNHIDNIIEYLVEYGANGFTLGTGNSIIANDNQITINNLHPSVEYDFYVRSICTSDTSAYSTVAIGVTTQPIATLPYFCDFEDNNENINWGIRNGNEQDQWFIGNAVNNTTSGATALYISSDQGATNSYLGGSSVWAYRDIHFSDTMNAGEYILSFDWRCLGETRAGSQNDYLRVAIGEPTLVNAGNPNILYVSSNTLERLNGSSDWQSVRYIFPNTFADTTFRLYFLWYSDGSTANQPPAAIDNISIQMNTCISPKNITLNNPGDTYAGIVWNSDNSLWVIEYKTIDEENWTIDTASVTPSFRLTNLEEDTEYMIRVKSICDNDIESEYSDILIFTTLSHICPPPADIHTTVAPGTAHLNWTRSENELGWNITLSLDETEISSIFVTDTFYTFTDLTSDTLYNVSMYTLCADSSESTPSDFSFISAAVTYYTITAQSSGEGTIYPAGEISIEEGSDTTFTFTPNAEHVVSQVFVDGEAVTERTSYTFHNVNANHTISVEFVVSVPQYRLDEQVVIYPNPAQERLYINTSTSFDYLTITDMVGKIIHQETMTTGNREINISSLHAGIYFISFYGKEGVVSKKMIKQ